MAMVKAITSCFTRDSSSWIRATSTLARVRIAAAASLGTWPASASVSVAASSTSSHFANLFASLQTRPISWRVYRGIKALSSEEIQQAQESPSSLLLHDSADAVIGGEPAARTERPDL